MVPTNPQKGETKMEKTSTRAEKLSAFLQSYGFKGATVERCSDGVFKFYLGNSVNRSSDTYRVFQLTADDKAVIEHISLRGTFQKGKNSSGIHTENIYTTIHLLDGVYYQDLDKIDRSIYDSIPDNTDGIPSIHRQEYPDSATTIHRTYSVPKSGYVLEDVVEFWTYIWPDGQTYDESTTYHVPKLYRVDD